MNVKSPNPTDIYVGSRVRMQRQMRGMSQERLADQLGITFQQVQKYEKGVNRIGASRLQTIASVLGVQVAFFFDQDASQTLDTSGIAGLSAPREDVSSFLKSKEGLALNKYFLKITDPAVRRSVLTLVRSVAESQDEKPVVADTAVVEQAATL